MALVLWRRGRESVRFENGDEHALLVVDRVQGPDVHLTFQRDENVEQIVCRAGWSKTFTLGQELPVRIQMFQIERQGARLRIEAPRAVRIRREQLQET